MAFVDLKKTFDRVPLKVLWWALRVVGVPEWLVKLVQAMYVGSKSRTCVNGSFSEEFRAGCPWERLTKKTVWKNVLESKGLRVNMGKPKL